MQRRTFWRNFSVATLLISLLATVLVGCGGSTGGGGTGNQSPVTLTFSSWQGGAAGDAYQAVIKSYQKLHPNVTIKYVVLDASNYTTLLNTHFAAGDASDIVAYFGSAFSGTSYIKSGYLADLSDQPWAMHLLPSVKANATSPEALNKVYALPVVQDAGGVVYNKDIFDKLHLQIPTTWPQFLQVCNTIKAAGITPLAVGAKDGWPLTQIINYMVINTVYRSDPNFAAKVAAGQATYAGSAEWQQAVKDMAALKPYFNTGFSSSTFADTTNLLATGKAAMTINGSFTLPPTETANPNVHLGMFAVPYVQDSSVKPNLATFVDVVLGVSAKSRHVDEAKKFLQYFAQPDVMASFLTQRQGLPTLDNVGTYKADPALNDVLPLLKDQSFNTAAMSISDPVGLAMWKDLQAVLTGNMTPLQMLQDIDRAAKG